MVSSVSFVNWPQLPLKVANSFPQDFILKCHKRLSKSNEKCPVLSHTRILFHSIIQHSGLTYGFSLGKYLTLSVPNLFLNFSTSYM
jgi:hypothetical protein